MSTWTGTGARAAVHSTGDQRRVPVREHPAAEDTQPGGWLAQQFHAGMPGLGRSELQTAQALADAARIAVLQQRAIHRSEVVARQLRAARTSQIIIEQAKACSPSGDDGYGCR
jgi:hypothetical protein